ncbi:AraC family transcriptional regulator [Paenibacillus sp. HB172176]|uniref:AraC family transcriptional regulator n=1 Tax=Paenibacillus sp. HB172176 TaxID=2493690 RepID=UPI0014386D93|nr:AraC family transcriptional regulator [Paenibacillus sp. HB172176]
MIDIGIQILWTARYDYKRGEQLRRHQHAYYQLLWIADGNGQFGCGDATYELEPGAILFIRPHEPHGLTASKHSGVKTLDIKYCITSPEWEAVFAAIPTKTLAHGKEASWLLERIRREGLIRQTYYKEMARLHLAELLFLLSRSVEGIDPPREATSRMEYPKEGHSGAKRAEAWIAEHIDRSWTIHDMAGELGYTPNYLGQLFKAYKGTTIAAYAKEVRIRQSKEWLTYSDFSIKQIAERSGFKTVHHFSRVFKQQEGITPGGWISREKQGIRKDVMFDEFSSNGSSNG